MRVSFTPSRFFPDFRRPDWERWRRRVGIFSDELNIYSFVGVIMLIGIVKKNAIMMIDFAIEAQRTSGTATGGDLSGVPDSFPTDHDDYSGGVGGDARIAMGLGAGGEARRPMGLAGGRGADGVAIADAVYYACVLHIYGAVPADQEA